MSDPVSATALNTQLASLPGPSQTGAASSSGQIAGHISSLGQTQGAGQGGDFAAVLGDMISGVNHNLQNAEAMSIKGIKGEANVQEVVHSLMSAEQSLKMAVAVRDKIVSAYLDISRMQI